jgi:riboflavin kinase/FMN adenylyltransferase
MMQRITDISQLETAPESCVLTIGNFDGVHLGHQQILTACERAAVDMGTQVLAMTFEPHPLVVVRPDLAPGVLTPLPAKAHLLAECGVDCLFVVESEPEMLALSAEQFVQRFLVESIKPSLVIEGESFNFGAGRSGNAETLAELGEANGFAVEVVAAKETAFSAGRPQKVSSTLIRRFLEEGNVTDAATALTRPYRLTERIIAGRGKGARLGFPTANMNPPEQIVPAHGVYAGFVAVADTHDEVLAAKADTPAALSIGTSATYGDACPLLIEAHILEGEPGDLYDKYLAMDFVAQIRGQQKFDSESALAEQIAKDCDTARELLKA